MHARDWECVVDGGRHMRQPMHAELRLGRGIECMVRRSEAVNGWMLVMLVLVML